jgi:hypothetical protein
VCAKAQVKGLVNSKQLPHHTHCTPPHSALDHNNVEEFLVISQKKFRMGFEALHQKRLQLLNDGTLEITIVA